MEGGGPSLLKQACDLQLEGIVSKRKEGRYRSGRSNNWSKVTCRKRDTFVVAGRGATAGVAGEAGPGCEAGHSRASGAGGL